MTQKEMVAGQLVFLDKVRKARARCSEMAEEANRLELPILAREWDYLGKQLESAIGNQVRAFRNGALTHED